LAFFIFLETQPAFLHAIQSSVPGRAGLVLAGGVTAFVSLALLTGMGWYFWHLDSSPIWARAAWVIVALIPLPIFAFAAPFILVAYYLFVHRRRVLQARKKTQSVAGA
jgi:Zn-dependent protease with chaperone function